MRGHFLLLLHAHLPFVRHPEDENFLEEDWFYEAVVDTYLPLLEMLFRLAEEELPFRLTVSLSPTLLSMLGDPLLKARFERRLEALLELSRREERTHVRSPRWATVSRFYREHLEQLGRAYHDTFQGDLIGAFSRLQQAGHLELITTSATHAFLPVWQGVPEAVRAQIQVGAHVFSHFLGQRPRGFWLPECGFHPSVDALLAREEIRFTFVDSRGFLHATPMPVRGLAAPVFTPAGVAVFGRDVETGEQVWSAQTGFPGHGDYREFYRDIGFEREIESLGPFVQADGQRKNTGLKYHRVTGTTEDKAVYEPERARQQALRDAESFFQSREAQFQRLSQDAPLEATSILAPYDAELFGHWWFEGPWFLEAFLRRCADSRNFQLSTPVEYLQAHSEHQLCQLHLSSWGMGGYSAMWLDASNDFLYRPLLSAAERMVRLSQALVGASGLRRRALNQACRELLLSQGSDWPFIMKTQTSVGYAEKRVQQHLENFHRLCTQAEEGEVKADFLSNLEARNNLFPELQFEVFHPEGLPRP